MALLLPNTLLSQADKPVSFSRRPRNPRPVTHGKCQSYGRFERYSVPARYVNRTAVRPRAQRSTNRFLAVANCAPIALFAAYRAMLPDQQALRAPNGRQI